MSHCQTPYVTELYTISRTDNYRVSNCFAILRGQNSPNSVAGGVQYGNFSLSVGIYSVTERWKGDYIIAIVASEPSAFLHQPVYSGPSDPDKDKAFHQFSKQEAQTHSHTSFLSNSISRCNHCQKDAHAEKPPEATLPWSHLTSDYELTNINQTHHSWSWWSLPFFVKMKLSILSYYLRLSQNSAVILSDKTSRGTSSSLLRFLSTVSHQLGVEKCGIGHGLHLSQSDGAALAQIVCDIKVSKR